MVGVVLSVGDDDMIEEVDAHQATCLSDGFCQFVISFTGCKVA
jgi:hypothetical protein